MDISKEFESLTQSKENIKNILENIEHETEEIFKKQHLFKVLNAVFTLEKFSEFLKENNADYIAINMRQNHNDEYYLVICVYDKDDKEISPNIMKKEMHKYNELNSPFNKLANLDLKNLGKEIKLFAYHSIKIEEGFGNKILDLLLSNELRTILNYEQMQNDLTQNKTTASKKVKL